MGFMWAKMTQLPGKPVRWSATTPSSDCRPMPGLS
jgi:hypothetical protein